MKRAFPGLCFSTALLMLLVACNGGGAPAKNLPPGVPKGAIHVEGDLYMVPLGKKDGNCPMYRAHSTKGAAVMAIFYRTAEGKFVMDKSNVDCS